MCVHRIGNAELNLVKKGYIRINHSEDRLTFMERVKQFFKTDWYMFIPGINLFHYGIQYFKTDDEISNTYNYLANYTYEEPNRGNTIPAPNTEEFKKEEMFSRNTSIGRIVYIRENDKDNNLVLVKRIVRKSDR
jgi:hypothetical protein